MATIKQIAQKAGVSRRTVDRVINHRGAVRPETAERIQKIIDELDYKPNTAGQTLAAGRKKIKLAFCSVKGKKSVIHEEIRKGAFQKARELEQLGVNVQFYIVDRDHPLKKDEINQILEEFHCDGLAVVPGDEEIIHLLIQKAETMKIPIIFYNTDQTKFKRNYYVGCNYVKAGQMAAGLIGLGVTQSMEVGVFTIGSEEVVLGHPSYTDRVKGFEKEIHNKYPLIEVVDHYFLGHDVFDYFENTKKAVLEHPNLGAIYLVNPGDYSVCEAIKKVIGDKKIRLITNDLTKEIIPFLKERIVSATISQDPESQGRIPLQILFNLLVLGKEPDQEVFYTDLNIYIPQCL